MSTLLYGSICLTDLINKAKEGHSAFSKASNGKVYVNFQQWINDDKDQYGNNSSILLSSKKEMRELEGKVYFGNAKLSEPVIEEVKPDDIPDLNDLPF